MKTQDKLGRWLFSEHTTRPIADFKPNTRQVRWLQFINLHGPQSSMYLFECTKSTHKCPDNARRMLRQLFDGRLVCKPKQQRETEGADGNYHIYDITTNGIDFLKSNNLYVDALRPTGQWVHQYMTSCITASIHILADREGYKYIPGHEILERSENWLGTDVAFKWKSKVLKSKLIPDSIFAIDYGGSYLAFIVEADRNTEPNKPISPYRKSALRSVKQYANFVGKSEYKQHYQLNCPLVILNVTVSEDHAQRVLQIIEDEVGPCRYQAFGIAPMFSTPFRPPTQLLSHLFEGALARNGKDPFVIKK